MLLVLFFCRGDKKAASEGPDEKELKKKEKQRLEKEKKELKEKQEREKKEQKEREKKENEMKKKFKVSGVILTEEEGMTGEWEWGRVGYMSWHTNLSGFIPRSRRVVPSNICRLKRNLCKHASFVRDVLSAAVCYYRETRLSPPTFPNFTEGSDRTDVFPPISVNEVYLKQLQIMFCDMISVSTRWLFVINHQRFITKLWFPSAT